jgi:hypothetical protein
MTASASTYAAAGDERRGAPQALAGMLAASWLAQAISVMAKAGIADLLADGPLTVDKLAQLTATNADALQRILRALASRGIFAEQPDGPFALTPLAEPLRRDAPDSLNAYAILTGDALMWQAMGAMEYSLRTGDPAFRHIFGCSSFEYHAQHPDAAALYDEALRGIGRAQDEAVVAAYDFREAGTVVDVGGGRGGLLARILAASPQSHGVLFDLPHVVAHSHAFLTAQGLPNRCQVEAGDFFSEVPRGGDIYLLRKVLHDWTDEEALAILRCCLAAMAPAARLLVLEMLLPPGNTPSYAKLLDLMMLVRAGGRERSEASYGALLRAAGFTLARCFPTTTSVWIMEAHPL